jgi:hypothetical protein
MQTYRLHLLLWVEDCSISIIDLMYQSRLAFFTHGMKEMLNLDYVLSMLTFCHLFTGRTQEKLLSWGPALNKKKCLFLFLAKKMNHIFFMSSHQPNCFWSQTFKITKYGTKTMLNLCGSRLRFTSFSFLC